MARTGPQHGLRLAPVAQLKGQSGQLQTNPTPPAASPGRFLPHPAGARKKRHTKGHRQPETLVASFQHCKNPEHRFISRLSVKIFRPPGPVLSGNQQPERLRARAGEHRRFGYRRLHELLKCEGWRVSHKLIARLCQEERLVIRRRHRQKRGAGAMSGDWCPIAASQRWSMDFTPTPCSRLQCVAILVDFSLPGRRVTLMLDDIVRERGYPRYSCGR